MDTAVVDNIIIFSFQIFKQCPELPVVNCPGSDELYHTDNWVNNMVDIQLSFTKTFLADETVER